MSWSKVLLSGSIGSFAGAFVGFVTAYYMANENKKIVEQEIKRKTLNDMYSVVTQLGGFINYFQYACHMNSALATKDYQNIIDRINCLNKDVFDASQQFFYNSEYKENVQRALSGFLELYIGWKGYRPLMLTEIFFEYSQINCMQIKAIECLNIIIEEYSDNKRLVIFIENVVDHKDAIGKRCRDLNEKMKFVFNNLNYILDEDNFLRFVKNRLKDENIEKEDIKKKIICQFFKNIHTKDMLQFPDNSFEKFLFNEEITSINFNSHEGIRIRGKEQEFGLEEVGFFLYRLFIEA